MSKIADTQIIIDRLLARDVAEGFLSYWRNGGYAEAEGRVREARMQERIKYAPKRTGWPWARRDRTEAEKREWVEGVLKHGTLRDTINLVFAGAQYATHLERYEGVAREAKYILASLEEVGVEAVAIDPTTLRIMREARFTI